MVQWSDQDIVLTAFGDSEEMSGFNTNETFVWRFWDASKNEYYLLMSHTIHLFQMMQILLKTD